MHNKSVEERAKDVITELRHILSKLGWNDAAEIEQKVYHAIISARQDQGVVGTQGREEYFQMVAQLAYNEGMVRMSQNVLINFMRANWPVSEGEGMRWIKASEGGKNLPVIKQLHSLAIKYKGNPSTLIMFNGQWYWDTEIGHPRETMIVHESSWSAIEWLYEPLPSPPQNQK